MAVAVRAAEVSVPVPVPVLVLVPESVLVLVLVLVASAQDFSKSLAPLWIEDSTSRAALVTVSFIFLSSSSSIERLTSALTSAT